jgi:REP element-mobilizing transposase RayT
MSRPARPLVAGAFYHVTARGNRRTAIFVDDRDHLIWLDKLGASCFKHGLICHSFCAMPNHFHLLLQTPRANLSSAMRELNGLYSQHFNRRHQMTGHLFQGRFHAVLLQKDQHFHELTRYLPLNPVRARLVERAEDWRWSSYPYLIGLAAAPAWLNIDETLRHHHGNDLAARITAFRAFVRAGVGLPDPLARKSLSTFSELANREQAMASAARAGQFTLREIAEHFGVAARTVSRAVQRWNDSDGDEPVSTLASDPKVDTGSAIKKPRAMGVARGSPWSKP